jgi:large subunit ribosomal protein L10
MNRAEKQQEIDFLSDCFRKARVALCADYRGLTVAQITELRRGLRQSGGVGRVVKNTLASISAGQAYGQAAAEEVEKFTKTFSGPTLLIFSFDDPVASTKVVADFSKKNENLKVKGGWFEEAFVDVSGVAQLASMPSKEQLQAKLLAVINAPATQLVRLLQAPATQITRVIQAQKEKIEQAAA